MGSALRLVALQGVDSVRKYYEPLKGVLPTTVFFEDFVQHNTTMEEGGSGKDFIVHVKLRNLHESRRYEWRFMGYLTHRVEGGENGQDVDKHGRTRTRTQIALEFTLARGLRILCLNKG